MRMIFFSFGGLGDGLMDGLERPVLASNDADDAVDQAVHHEPVLEVALAGKVNFASAQNKIPVIHSLALTNPTNKAYTGLTLRLDAYPAILRPKSWSIEQLSPGQKLVLKDLDLRLDLERLDGLDEAERGTLTFTLHGMGEGGTSATGATGGRGGDDIGQMAEEPDLQDGTDLLASWIHDIDLLPRDHWGGLAAMDRLLAAYVSPNDPAIAGVLKEAARLLEREGHDGSMDGYQSGDPGRAWMLSGAIWSAVTGLGLTYSNPPASFEIQGQKIRLPERVTREGLATCLDTSLFMAAAWEQAGLNPVVVFTEGHAFVGVWLVDRDFGTVTEPDVVAVRKAIQAREFCVAETVALTKKPAIGLDQASQQAKQQLSEAEEHKFQAAIDIKRARSAGIYPLASHRTIGRLDPDSAAQGGTEDDAITAAALPKPLPLGDLSDDRVDATPTTPKGRIEQWQGKLLDLTLRSRLLNYRDTKQTLPCLVPDVGTFEDDLHNGISFKVYPIKDEDPIGERQVSSAERKDIYGRVIDNAYAQKQISVDLTKKDADNRLLSLYRKAKSDMQEGGTNTLFLAAGFLRWQRDGDPKTYRAPLLLIPVKLSRASALSNFRLAHHEDETRFNATLLQLLKRDFAIDLPSLEGDLPEDESGVDIPLVFELMRRAVRDVPGFEVVEETAISTFSFAKYLMWKDLVDRTDQLRTNRLVSYLLDNPDRPFSSGVREPIEPDALDRKKAPEQLITPLPADSSQLAAVVAAEQGQDFVLIGPPGTGKSQTIANMICQLLANKKTVLFVAEKAAALDVVKRRLDDHGVGDAVLELHSNKTDRKRVIEKLGRAWDRSAQYTEKEWVNINEGLRLKRDEPNTYVQAIHAKGTQGISIYEALGWIAKKPQGLTIEFHKHNKDLHDQKSFTALLDLADDLQRAFTATGDAPPLIVIGAADWSFGWQDVIISAAHDLNAATARLRDCKEALTTALGLAPGDALDAGYAALFTALAERLKPTALDVRAVPDRPAADLEQDGEALQKQLDRLAKYQGKLVAHYDEAEIERIPLDDLDADWRRASTAIWPLSFFKRRQLRKLLTTYAAQGVADPDCDLRALRTIRECLAALRDNPVASLAGDARDGKAAMALITQAITTRDTIQKIAPHVTDAVAWEAAQNGLMQGQGQNLQDVFDAWQSASDAYQQAAIAFTDKGGVIPDNLTAPDLMAALDHVAAAKTQLQHWVNWRSVENKALAKGLGPLIDALKADQINLADEHGLRTALREAYARWWLPKAMDSHQCLRQFTLLGHEYTIRAFRELDRKASKQAPQELMRRIHHSLPGANTPIPSGSELGQLKKLRGQTRPRKTIRSLLADMPTTFSKLTPCVLMSPLSIAQYLPAGQAAFDVVIFDEASQITTWDAVGAIARAKQSIIVGDPKQMPPTNNFGRAADDDDDDDGDSGVPKDMPSILEEVKNCIPSRQLDWHYRSRDEALIAFSNSQYYNDRLVTFPAPATGSEAVQFHKVEGIYARGEGRKNPIEAKAVVAMIKTRLIEWLALEEKDRPTLGVVTFNAEQQGLIQDLLDDMRRANTAFEWFFAEDRQEPLMVKNLENIQGDERDVMLFSITFGPTSTGTLSMNFGPMNQEGGEKRLNVAVTRARQELHVFSSILPDDIDLSRTKAMGVQHLKAFLDYAARGAEALKAADQGSLGPAENPFEEAVAEALRQKGWEVRTQIGVSKFRIDLGIVNPERAGAYLAGIECDGATYHSAATARDRDKVRQAVLEGLGWHILRVWSTDWFRDAATVVERLDQALNDRLTMFRQEREAEAVAADQAAEEAELEVDAGPSASDIKPSAALDRMINPDRAQIPAQAPDPERFYNDDYLPVLRAMIDEVLVAHAPLPINSLAAQIARRHGWQRTGKQINTRVQEAAAHTDQCDETGKVFVWPQGGFTERTPYRGLENRWIQEVSRTEIASVLDDCAADIAQSEDPILTLARTLGIARLSDKARRYLGEVYEWYLGD